MPVRSIIPATLLSFASMLPAAQADDACRYLPAVTFPLRSSGGAWEPTVDGAINGKPAVMLFATALSKSSLVVAAVSKYQLPLTNSRNYSVGAAGVSANYTAKITDFSVGGAHSGKVEMRVLGNLGGEHRFDALLGADFALQMDLEISVADKYFKLFRASHCGNTYLAYWSPDAAVVPFVDADTGHRNPRFIVEINGTPVEAAIDTAASRTSITRAAAARAGIRVDGPNVVKTGSTTGVGDTRIDTWQVKVDSFALGSETIKNANLVILDNPPQGNIASLPDMLLGADFLRAHRVLIAMSQRRLYFTYQGGEVFPPMATRSN